MASKLGTATYAMAGVPGPNALDWSQPGSPCRTMLIRISSILPTCDQRRRAISMLWNKAKSNTPCSSAISCWRTRHTLERPPARNFKCLYTSIKAPLLHTRNQCSWRRAICLVSRDPKSRAFSTVALRSDSYRSRRQHHSASDTGAHIERIGEALVGRRQTREVA
jgi:hypothetical protein